MYRCFLQSAMEVAALSVNTVCAPWRGKLRPALPRGLLSIVLLPLFWLWFLAQWAGLLLDDLFFPEYRAVELRDPVFVLGVPRTGTTALHRMLARDEQFTTFRTWECFFAPSVSMRKLLRGLAAADRWLGAPLIRALSALESALGRWIGDVHEMRLDEPEEDYLCLLPILRSFILIVPFPSSKAIWQMGLFDRDTSEAERRRVLGFYRACLQRHVHVEGRNAEGREKRLLSKNAAYASWIGALRETFPDARFIACTRDPREALASQLSSLQRGFQAFGWDLQEGEWRDRIIECLVHGYEHLVDEVQRLPPERGCFVPIEALRTSAEETVRGIYRSFGLRISPGFEAGLRRASEESKRFRSGHHYALEDYGLSEAEVKRRFEAVYESSGWTR